AVVPLVELVEFVLAVRAGGERDAPIGVQVIDVIEGQVGVEGRVNGGGDAVLAEGAERIEADHFVFMLLATIAGDEVMELIHIKDGEAGGFDGPEIAAAAFDGKDALR